MDSARKTHFIAQYVLIFSYISRVYYGYATKHKKDIPSYCYNACVVLIALRVK